MNRLISKTRELAAMTAGAGLLLLAACSDGDPQEARETRATFVIGAPSHCPLARLTLAEWRDRALARADSVKVVRSGPDEQVWRLVNRASSRTWQLRLLRSEDANLWLDASRGCI